MASIADISAAPAQPLDPQAQIAQVAAWIQKQVKSELTVEAVGDIACPTWDEWEDDSSSSQVVRLPNPHALGVRQRSRYPGRDQASLLEAIFEEARNTLLEKL